MYKLIKNIQNIPVLVNTEHITHIVEVEDRATEINMVSGKSILVIESLELLMPLLDIKTGDKNQTPEIH